MDVIAALLRSFCHPAPLHTLEYTAPVGVLWMGQW